MCSNCVKLVNQTRIKRDISSDYLAVDDELASGKEMADLVGGDIQRPPMVSICEEENQVFDYEVPNDSESEKRSVSSVDYSARVST